MSIDWSNPDRAAVQLAGNHRKFESFGWHDAPEDDQDWALVYTHNRDSGLLDQSNADAIDAEMKEFGEDAIPQHHGHWAVGWVDGWAIRVRGGEGRKKGELTPAFHRWCELQASLEDYPLLDEEDHSRREYEATLENIGTEGREFVMEPAPEDWDKQVFSWLWDNEQDEVSSVDDRGGCPSEEAVKKALAALGLIDPYHLYAVVRGEEVIATYEDEDEASRHWENLWLRTQDESARVEKEGEVVKAPPSWFSEPAGAGR